MTPHQMRAWIKLYDEVDELRQAEAFGTKLEVDSQVRRVIYAFNSLEQKTEEPREEEGE